MSLAKRLSAVGGLTMLSRVLGLTRDLLIARFLGAGMAADAFFIAFKLPNFFRRLFAEGAFTVGFVPLFARALGKDITPESQAAAEAFAARVLAWFLPVLLIFLLIMEAAMVPVMLGLTGGFEGDAVKFSLAVELGRYTFPYLVLISLAAFLGGILNAYERFSAAAFVPVLLNIFLISAMLLGAGDTLRVARYLAAAVSLSGLAQFLWLYVAVRRAGVSLRLPFPKLTDDVKDLLRVIGPAAIGAGVMQINLLIDTLIAARMLPEGSVSWLFYADRLNQLPLGVIGVAVGTVLLPSISRLLAGGDAAGANRQQNRALEFSLLLTLPAAGALAAVSLPIISSIFERAAFAHSDSIATAAALSAYALGLPAYVIAKALAPGYFARKDTVTPVKFATVSLILNTTLNLILIRTMAHVGLAAATAIAAWVNVFLLYRGLRVRGHIALERRTVVRVLKFLASTVVMAVAVGLAARHFSAAFLADGPTRLMALAALVVFGAGIYFILLLLLRAMPLSDLRGFISRKRA
ncbi:murein biosynthesis integral membrane protein MurJ [Kordiimonas marina]|uniref:murein biosynthesis integral membrane protein MurJ n=1 Tax=Kordiimonas marina TaxID=2872312 RepID=UPI001FF44F04|nr:murein biosynthesis integral membrane protein MurJ [Kordiimonas marina]